MLLADLGAEVIKLEHPSGDETRGWGPPYAGTESAYYLSINRNKRSVVLDLKQKADLEKAYAIVRKSDVLLHNFRQGDDKKLGFDLETVKKINPTLVYAHISGYGSTGPDASKPGYDLLAQALTGFMSITGQPDGAPTKVGVAVVDVLTGLNAALGIVASLYAQKVQGERVREVETSLLEAGLSGLVNVASNYLITGQTPQRYANAHASIVPYQSFETADKPVAVAAANERQFAAFAKAVGRTVWLSDERFNSNGKRVENRATFVPLLQTILLEKPRAQWLDLLETAGVPCAPVNSVAEVLETEQVQARQMVQRCPHPTIPDLSLVASGLKLDGQATPLYRHPPLLGEHTEEVLEELETEDG